MAVILADTDVLIDFLAGVQPAADQVAGYIAAGQLQISTISCFELLSGAREGKRGDRLRHFLEAIPALPLDRKAAEVAAVVRKRLESAGNPIGMGDSLIAGIAIANGVALFTRNRKHFERVVGLQLVDLQITRS